MKVGTETITVPQPNQIVTVRTPVTYWIEAQESVPQPPKKETTYLLELTVEEAKDLVLECNRLPTRALTNLYHALRQVGVDPWEQKQ